MHVIGAYSLTFEKLTFNYFSLRNIEHLVYVIFISSKSLTRDKRNRFSSVILTEKSP